MPQHGCGGAGKRAGDGGVRKGAAERGEPGGVFPGAAGNAPAAPLVPGGGGADWRSSGSTFSPRGRRVEPYHAGAEPGGSPAGTGAGAAVFHAGGAVP